MTTALEEALPPEEQNTPTKPDEWTRFDYLREVITRGQRTFIQVGLALAEIRDERLYLRDYKTFEDFCQAEYGWTASRSRYLIGSAEAVAEMQSVTIVTQNEAEPNTKSVTMVTHAELPPVQNEGQARELAKIVDPEERAEVWREVNEVAANLEMPVTANLIKETRTVKAIEPRFQTHEEHREEVRNSPGTKWNNFLYEMLILINSVRDGGGISKLACRWTPAQKAGYLDKLKRLQENVTKIAEQLEGEIKYDNN